MKNGLVIADAGPIFSLAIIDELELLNHLFDEIKISKAVWEEISLDKTTKFYIKIEHFFKPKITNIKGFEKELKSLNINLNNFNQIDTTKYKNEKIETLRFISSNNEYLDISFYKSGKKKSYGWARKGQVDGKYIDWFENGNLEWTRKYNLGHQIGKSIQYYKNGNKKKVHNNENDAYKTYYKNGILREYFLDTVTITYYLNGQIFQKYNDTGEVEFYNANGKSVFKGKHSNGYLTSKDKKYSGFIICFFQNNDTAYYAKYDNGQLYGKYFGYYGNGNIRFKGLENNNKESYLTNYYLNGNKRFTRKGDSIIRWDKNGKLEK